MMYEMNQETDYLRLRVPMGALGYLCLAFDKFRVPHSLLDYNCGRDGRKDIEVLVKQDGLRAEAVKAMTDALVAAAQEGN